MIHLTKQELVMFGTRLDGDLREMMMIKEMGRWFTVPLIALVGGIKRGENENGIFQVSRLLINFFWVQL